MIQVVGYVPYRSEVDVTFFLLQGLLRFYDAIIQGILRHINFDGKLFFLQRFTKAHFSVSMNT